MVDDDDNDDDDDDYDDVDDDDDDDPHPVGYHGRLGRSMGRIPPA